MTQFSRQLTGPISVELRSDEINDAIFRVPEGHNRVSIQAAAVSSASAAWPSGGGGLVLTVERSNSRANWAAYSPTKQLSAAGFVESFDPGAAWVRVIVSTTDSSGDRVRVSFHSYTEAE